MLELIHKQWIFQNSKVHFKRAEGITEGDCLNIFSKVEDLMHTPSYELLSKHQHLLESDFEALGASSNLARQFWIVSMESAISATRMVSPGRVLPGQMGKFDIRRRQQMVQEHHPNRSTVYHHTWRHRPTSSSPPCMIA